MPSRSGRTDHSLLTCAPCSHRRPELPVRKTDWAGRVALSTCRRGVAMCGIVSFTFRSPRVTAPTSQGVLRNDRLRPNPRRVAWQLDLDPRASPAGGRGAPGVHADADRPRRTLLSRDVGLDTHVADVANLMIWEDLRDIVLVGHSYGGVVVRHVADRMPDRINSLIYLDAFVPENGNALFDYLPDNGKSSRELAVAHGDGLKGSPIPASVFAVNAADAAWVDRQCTMHPLSSFEAPARVSGAGDGVPTIGYILACRHDGPFGQFYAKAGERRWWQEELACGHDVMLDMPNELTALLLQRT